MTAIEASQLWAADIECLRLQYAYTLRHWFDRFEANHDKVSALYDARFVRMWRFYLAASEQTFRNGRQAVFQFQLSRHIDAVPIIRNYLYQPQNALELETLNAELTPPTTMPQVECAKR